MSEMLDSALSKKLGITCFNKTWDYIEKSTRNISDDLDMINTAHASLWFWKNYKEHSSTNISIGLWQLSRVYALANDGLMALNYALECVEVSKNESVDSFYLAYGYEALARANLVLKNIDEVKINIEKSREALKSSKEKEINGLIQDLKSLEI